MKNLQITSFLDTFFGKLTELGIDISTFELDHVGYLTSSGKEYDELKPDILQLGTQIKESIVGGRRVCIVKLNDPIVYKSYSISGIELVEPKKEQVCTSGLDHAEFVVEDLPEFIKNYPNIDWDISAISRQEYPKVQYELGSNMRVKFHPKTILEEAASYTS